MSDALVQTIVRDRYGRIVRRELRWFIPVGAIRRPILSGPTL